MKVIIKFTLIFLSFFSTVLYAKKKIPLNVVNSVDLEKYKGKWYQISAIPAFFQRNCAQNTTAEYKINGDKIEVINTCERVSGEKIIAQGGARVDPNHKNSAKLQVSFVKILRTWIWLFGGNYWVLDLGKEKNGQYSHSIVGEPGRGYLWILGREKKMSPKKLVELESKIKKQGYDTCEIIVSQEGQLKGQKLCELKQIPQSHR